MTKAIDKDTIGGRVRYAREREMLTQREIAKAANIGQSHLAMIEAGKRTPGIPVLMRISKATGVRCDFLLYGNGPERVTTDQYASVELLGHIDLQACKVREIDDLGGKALEVTALNKDGSDGTMQIVSPAAIYRRHVLTKEEALRDAATRYRNPEPSGAKEPPPKPLPWAAFLKLITHCSGPCPDDVKLAAIECAEWYDKEQADIPF